MRPILPCLLFASALLLPAATSNVPVPVPVPAPAPAPEGPRLPAPNAQIGSASFYHPILDGRMTASGQTFSNSLMTAAHRTLEFGTRVRVTNLENLRSVIVTINDRGPYVHGRIIDLSHRAAAALGFVRDGVTRVRVQPLSPRSTS
jgi:rare lipoprotein A